MHTITRLVRSATVGFSVVLLTAASVHAQRPAPVVRLPAHVNPIQLDTLVIAWERSDASRGEVFAAVRSAFESLRIKPDYVDSLAGHIGVLKLRASTKLGGERLSTFFNCGRGMAGDNADQWRLAIAFVTFLRPSGVSSTEFGSGLAAQAQDMSGVSKDQVPCGSTGELETRIVKLAKQKLIQKRSY